MMSSQGEPGAVGPVGGQDAVVAVYDDEPFVHGVEDAPDKLLVLPDFFLGLFAFGYVLPGPAQDGLDAGLIALELRLRVQDPGRAVFEDEPIINAELFPVFTVSSIPFPGQAGRRDGSC
jgi:hypothetical protein